MTKRLSACLKFVDGKTLWNQYDCEDCRAKGIPHQVVEVPGRLTTDRSYWGSGLPTTMRECTGCGAQDGPWVSTSLVGDGW
jgi:hypothetical protein